MHDIAICYYLTYDVLLYILYLWISALLYVLCYVGVCVVQSLIRVCPCLCCLSMYCHVRLHGWVVVVLWLYLCLCFLCVVVVALSSGAQALSLGCRAKFKLLPLPLSRSAPPEWSVMNDPAFSRRPRCAKVDRAQHCSCDAGFHMSGTSDNSICQGETVRQ